MSNHYKDTMLGAERGRASVVWHMLTGDWEALCGCEEARDSENHMHSLTNRLERVTCDKCRSLLQAQQE